MALRIQTLLGLAQTYVERSLPWSLVPILLKFLLQNLNPVHRFFYNMLILPLEQGKFLQRVSTLALFTGGIGILSNHPYLGGGVCLGSIFAQNYWRYPVYGFRRTLDMSWIQLLIWTHLYAVWGSPIFPTYVSMQGMGGLFYVLSWYAHERYHPWVQTLLHAGVHLLANVSVTYFYIMC